MSFIQKAAANAPEIFLFLAIAIGTLLGRVRIRGFALGCDRLHPCSSPSSSVSSARFSFPPVLRSILFALLRLHHRISSRGPSSSRRSVFATLTQVVLALVIGGTGLVAHPASLRLRSVSTPAPPPGWRPAA